MRRSRVVQPGPQSRLLRAIFVAAAPHATTGDVSLRIRVVKESPGECGDLLRMVEPWSVAAVDDMKLGVRDDLCRASPQFDRAERIVSAPNDLDRDPQSRQLTGRQFELRAMSGGRSSPSPALT